MHINKYTLDKSIPVLYVLRLPWQLVTGKRNRFVFINVQQESTIMLIVAYRGFSEQCSVSNKTLYEDIDNLTMIRYIVCIYIKVISMYFSQNNLQYSFTLLIQDMPWRPKEDRYQLYSLCLDYARLKCQGHLV